MLTFEAISRLANAYGTLMGEDGSTQHKKRVPGGRKKLSRVVREVLANFDAAQIGGLMAALEGSAKLVEVDGITFYVWPGGRVLRARNGSTVHTVADGRCSCPRSSKRGEECKHVKANRSVAG